MRVLPRPVTFRGSFERVNSRIQFRDPSLGLLCRRHTEVSHVLEELLQPVQLIVQREEFSIDGTSFARAR